MGNCGDFRQVASRWRHRAARALSARRSVHQPSRQRRFRRGPPAGRVPLATAAPCARRASGSRRSLSIRPTDPLVVDMPRPVGSRCPSRKPLSRSFAPPTGCRSVLKRSGRCVRCAHALLRRLSYRQPSRIACKLSRRVAQTGRSFWRGARFVCGCRRKLAAPYQRGACQGPLEPRRQWTLERGEVRRGR